MRATGFFLVCSVALAGCQTSVLTPAPVQIASTFNPVEAAFIKKSGSVTIEGHAFLRQKTGGTVNAAGEIVRLIPATAYARERFAKLYGQAKFVAASNYPKTQDTDPRYIDYIRTTKAESTGRFTFDNVAPGSYFISTQVTWQKEGAVFSDGGAIYETVTITGRETDPVMVIVSGN